MPSIAHSGKHAGHGCRGGHEPSRLACASGPVGFHSFRLEVEHAHVPTDHVHARQARNTASALKLPACRPCWLFMDEVPASPNLFAVQLHAEFMVL